MTSDRAIRRIASVIGVACLATLGVTAVAIAVPAVRSRLAGPAVTTLGYVVGDHIDLEPALYDSARVTVVLFARAGCGACQRSKPGVAAIFADLSEHPDVRMVMVAPANSPDDELEFAREIGLDETRLFRMDTSKLRVRQVPAYAIVNSQGRILKAGQGVVTESLRRDVVQTALSGGPSSP